MILWLALGKITQQRTFVFHASPSSFLWSPIQSWCTEASWALWSPGYICSTPPPYIFLLQYFAKALSSTELTTIILLFFFWFSIFFVPFTSVTISLKKKKKNSYEFNNGDQRLMFHPCSIVYIYSQTLSWYKPNPNMYL